MSYYVSDRKQGTVKKANAAKRGEHLKPGDLNARVACSCGKRPTIHPTGLCKVCHGPQGSKS